MSSKQKSTSKQEPEAASKPSFEHALTRLEEIIEKIEGEQLPLDDMVDCYEEGMKLLFSCRERIQQAKLRVETLEASFDSDQAPVAGGADDDNDSTAELADQPMADEDDEIRLF